MGGGRIFYVGEQSGGKAEGLGGKEKSILLNIKRVRTEETEVLMIKESTGNESLVYLFIITNLS